MARFSQFGISKQQMVSAAAGLATPGKIPFVLNVTPLIVHHTVGPRTFSRCRPAHLTVVPTDDEPQPINFRLGRGSVSDVYKSGVSFQF